MLGISNVNNKLSNGIVNAKWHLGGPNGNNYLAKKVLELYELERNTSAVYTGNPSNIYAKLGIIYPSDYGYATTGGSTTNKESCRAKPLYNWDDSSYSYCKNNNWIFNTAKFSNSNEWFISPITSNSASSCSLVNTGSFFAGYMNDSSYKYSVRPTFYLDSSILKIVGGTGTSTNPYHIG